MLSSFPLLSRFKTDMSDKTMDTLLRVHIAPLLDLAGMSPDQAELRLEEAWKALVVPSTQMRLVIRKIATAAQQYSEAVYTDEKTFLRNVYAPPLGGMSAAACAEDRSPAGTDLRTERRTESPGSETAWQSQPPAAPLPERPVYKSRG